MEVTINKHYIREVKPDFLSFLKSETGLSWLKERDEKDLFFTKYFGEESIEELEGVLRELLNKLWAFSGWTNKEYLLDQMLESDIERVRKSFKNLLYGEEDLARRFDEVREIRMMGPASISEILTHFDHEKYPIWNRRAACMHFCMFFFTDIRRFFYSKSLIMII
jgi:hypothetical protein